VASHEFPYLSAYPTTLHDQVRPLLLSGVLKERLSARYPQPSRIINDSLLRDYVLDLKNKFIKRSAPLSKIVFDDKVTALHGALGLHSFVSRVQGAKTKTKNELRVASIFIKLPEEFLRMVVVHELAHLKEKEHNKSFYNLCCHMEPNYHQLELDLRLVLTARGSEL
jgi:predicted metal-dependent hydrolase